MANQPPKRIGDFEVMEYGFFERPLLPSGYEPPPDGSPPLQRMQNVAICRLQGLDEFHVLFCSADWQLVTGDFYYTLESAKQSPLVEFGQEISIWHNPIRDRNDNEAS